MTTPTASRIALLSTPRPGAILPLSCRRGVPVVSNGAVVGTVADLISGDWIRVRWTNGMVSEVHGSRIGDVEADGCDECGSSDHYDRCSKVAS